MSALGPRPVTWVDVRRMRDIYPAWGCAEIAAELERRQFVTDYEHGMAHFVRCTSYQFGWPNPKGKRAAGRATWRDVAAMRHAHPGWSCKTIADELQADGLSAERKHLTAWVRSVFARHGWANPGSNDPFLRAAATAQALIEHPELLRIRERARELVGQGTDGDDADRVDEIAPPVFSEKMVSREARSNRFRMTGDFD